MNAKIESERKELAKELGQMIGCLGLTVLAIAVIIAVATWGVRIGFWLGWFGKVPS